MKLFNEINPVTIQRDSSVLAKISDPDNQSRTYFILLQGSHTIIASTKLHTFVTSGDTKWLTYQLEMPKEGIPWIVNTLENKFLKLSHEGGLPADVRHYEEVVNGEKLGIGRQMNLGSDGHRESGYSIITMSRPEQGGRIGKRMNFTDSFLFEHGFFDLLKRIAEQIESGLL